MINLTCDPKYEFVWIRAVMGYDYLTTCLK